MLALMTKVMIISDILNLGLPIGQEAYIIAHNRRVNVAYQYLIRIPTLQKEFWVVEQDIKPLTDADMANDYSREAEKVLIDVALQTKQFDIIRHLKGDHQE